MNSTIFTLSTKYSAEIINQPSNQLVTPQGGQASFSAATGKNLKFVWQKNSPSSTDFIDVVSKSGGTFCCNTTHAVGMTLISCSITVLPRCYAPPFCDLLSGKRGGGVTTRTCAFASQLSPPPPPLPRIRVLCSAVEDENSFDRHAVAVLKDGRVVGHVHVAKHSR